MRLKFIPPCTAECHLWVQPPKGETRFICRNCQIIVWGDLSNPTIICNNEKKSPHTHKKDIPRKRKLRLLNEISARDGYYCHWCKSSMIPLDNLPLVINGSPPKNYPTLDHLIPYIKGGTWHVDNLVISCVDCNSKRGSDNFVSWKKKHLVDTLV